MTLPGKLWRLKKWLTVPEAARHLSIIFGEEVGKADVLRLALDGNLKLSVNFVNYADARIGQAIPIGQARMWVCSYSGDDSKGPLNYLAEVYLTDELPDEIKKGLQDKSMFLYPQGIVCRDDQVIILEEKIHTLSGVYDLLMLGNERLDVEYQYQQLTGGPEVTLICIDGAFVEREDGKICQLQESFNEGYIRSCKEKKNRPYNHPDNFFPAGGLPDDSVLVVRISALTDLQERLAKEDEKTTNGKPLAKDGIGKGERKTWLKIIHLLAAKLAEKNPAAYTRKDGSFNASKFEEVLKNKAGDLLGKDDNTENTGYGLSNDNLKKIFDEVKNLF